MQRHFDRGCGAEGNQWRGKEENKHRVGVNKEAGYSGVGRADKRTGQLHESDNMRAFEEVRLSIAEDSDHDHSPA